MLDKLMIIVLIFLIVTLIFKYYKEKQTCSKENFSNDDQANQSMINIMKDNANIDDIENKLNDFKVRFPDSMTHEKTLKEDASLVQEFQSLKKPEEWKITDGNDLSFNVYWNDKLKSTNIDNVTDPSGYVLQCVNLVKQRGKNLQELMQVDVMVETN